MIHQRQPAPGEYSPASDPECSGDPFLPRNPHLLPAEMMSFRLSSVFLYFFVYTFHAPHLYVICDATYMNRCEDGIGRITYLVFVPAVRIRNRYIQGTR